MKIDLGLKPKICYVCRGGPENGPFSAMACRILTKNLNADGYNISGIYASSGSTPTSLLGCVGDFDELCYVWDNLSPEDIVGKSRRAETIYRIIRKESILTSCFLRNLIESNWNLDTIFQESAIPIKFPAVDLLSGEYVIFSNKIAKHKRWFLEGVLGSMGLVPFLQPQVIYDPDDYDLIEKEKMRNSALLLIDGGFKGNMLLEEAIRDYFDVVFLIDIHGMKATKFNLNMKYHWTGLIRNAFHLLSNSNDVRQFQITDRINEEIRIKNALVVLAKKLPAELRTELDQIIIRLDEDRLRLGDKNETKIYIVSNEKYSTLFNFAKFERDEVKQLLAAGREAAERTLELLYGNSD